MGKDVRLNSSEWIDLVFEEKNKKYGAYHLRNTSGRVHIYALLAVLVLVVLLIAGVTYSDAAKAKKQDADGEKLGNISSTVELTNLKDLEDKLNEEKAAENAAQQMPETEFVAPKLAETMMFTAPVIEDDKNVTSFNQMKSQQQVTQSTAMVSFDDITGSKDPDAVDLNDLREIQIKLDREAMQQDNKLYDRADQMPQFPGGMGALRNYLAANLMYPQGSTAVGAVLVRFVVEKDGSIGDIRILEGLDHACNNEALRVIRAMPRWTAGQHQGKTVRVWFTQTIVFEA